MIGTTTSTFRATDITGMMMVTVGRGMDTTMTTTMTVTVTVTVIKGAIRTDNL
jgi:hypothetical protein